MWRRSPWDFLLMETGWWQRSRMSWLQIFGGQLGPWKQHNGSVHLFIFHRILDHMPYMGLCQVWGQAILSSHQNIQIYANCTIVSTLIGNSTLTATTVTHALRVHHLKYFHYSNMDRDSEMFFIGWIMRFRMFWLSWTEVRKIWLKIAPTWGQQPTSSWCMMGNYHEEMLLGCRYMEWYILMVGHNWWSINHTQGWF